MLMKEPDFPHSRGKMNRTGVDRVNNQYGRDRQIKADQYIILLNTTREHAVVQFLDHKHPFYGVDEPYNRFFDELEAIWLPADQITTLEQLVWEAWMLETWYHIVGADAYAARALELVKIAHGLAPLRYEFAVDQLVFTGDAFAALARLDGLRGGVATIKEKHADGSFTVEAHNAKAILNGELLMPVNWAQCATDEPAELIQCYQEAHRRRPAFHPMILSFVAKAHGRFTA